VGHEVGRAVGRGVELDGEGLGAGAVGLGPGQEAALDEQVEHVVAAREGPARVREHP
jgi:hypothetical protein